MSVTTRGWFVFACFMALAAPMTGCGDEDGDGGGDTPAANCQERCVSRLVECEVPENLAADGCRTDVCNHEPTESQLTCAENSTCEEILTTENLCGIGEDANNDPNNGQCPTLMCECNGVPFNGVFEANGECIDNCDDLCTSLGG